MRCLFIIGFRHVDKVSGIHFGNSRNLDPDFFAVDFKFDRVAFFHAAKICELFGEYGTGISQRNFLTSFSFAQVNERIYVAVRKNEQRTVVFAMNRFQHVAFLASNCSDLAF